MDPGCHLKGRQVAVVLVTSDGHDRSNRQGTNMTDSIWPAFHGECRALATDLKELSAEQWHTPSLCEGWDVEQVLAHLVATSKLTAANFVWQLARAGFRVNVATERGIAAERRGGSAGLLASLGELERSTKAPFGPKLSWLAELLIHGEDIRRPLGIGHSYPIDAVTRVTGFARTRRSRRSRCGSSAPMTCSQRPGAAWTAITSRG